VNDTIQFNSQISTVNTTNGATHLVKSGLGTLVLNGNNNFAGNFFINEGTVKVTNASGLGFGATMGATYAAGITTVNPGAVLDLNPVAGALTINEPIVLNGGSFINSNTSNANLAKLDSGIAALVLTNAGAGYTGNPTVSISGGGATTNATIAGGFGSGTATITLTAAGTGYTSTPTITLSGGGATTNATVTATLSSLSLIGGSNSLGGAGNLTINAAIADGSGGSGGFTKTGNGTVTLGGANTYTGATKVATGTLLVSGSITGSTATVSNSGSTLGGTGTIGSATVNSGAILQGGDGVSTTGALTSAGNISLADGSEIKFTLGAGGTHSTLARTGGLWAFDSDQAFIFNSGAVGGTYQDIITGLTGSETGLASISSWTVLNPEYAGSTFTFDGSNVDLVLVPEPTPAAALLIGFASLLGLQRFRRRAA
jgi:autotransporter-associated beta strand protein